MWAIAASRAFRLRSRSLRDFMQFWMLNEFVMSALILQETDLILRCTRMSESA